MGRVARRPWRSEETDTLQKLFEQGFSRVVISAKMNRPLGTIDSKLGALRWHRGIAPRKPWTEADVNLLITMIEAGKSVYTVGAKLSRSKTAIERKYRELKENGTLRKRKVQIATVLPVAHSEFIAPLTRAQLMGRRA